MKPAAIAAILLMTSVAFAQSEATTQTAASTEKKIEDPRTTTPKPLTGKAAGEDSALVRAAKKKPASRNKAKLHMDNSTVKASKGKLSETPGLPLVEVPDKVPDHSEKLAKYDRAVEEWKKQITENDKAIESLAQEINDLETLTGQYEENFYNEDDPGYRDVLEDKFAQVQDRLSKAREELAKARENEQTLANGKPRLD